jgi:hypothetical protein
MQLHCRLRGNCERNMLHRADRVAIALGLGTSGDFEEGKQPVAPHVEEVVTDFLERRISSNGGLPRLPGPVPTPGGTFIACTSRMPSTPT